MALIDNPDGQLMTLYFASAQIQKVFNRVHREHSHLKFSGPEAEQSVRLCMALAQEQLPETEKNKYVISEGPWHAIAFGTPTLLEWARLRSEGASESEIEYYAAGIFAPRD